MTIFRRICLSTLKGHLVSELFWEIKIKKLNEEYEERLKKQKEWEQVRIWTKWASSILDTDEKELFFLLYYLKTYPTFDVLSSIFWMWRTTAHSNIHRVLPILKELLQELWISPKRSIWSVDELKESFDWNILDLIIDWTERRHFRHKDNSKQEDNYSGKKNAILKKIL